MRAAAIGLGGAAGLLARSFRRLYSATIAVLTRRWWSKLYISRRKKLKPHGELDPLYTKCSSGDCSANFGKWLKETGLVDA